ncbi:MAG TPA: leucine--tRNA ligase [Phycisphaerae bacterium]|nr:leucine--tRNA ligase [Phycisphaerae bacterium]
MGYDFSTIESKWQKYWADNNTFVQPNPGQDGFDSSKPKYYVLDMFPYPSGAGLHVGHPEGYTATDIVARYKRMKGFNVLHPMGYDSFGLPAEQYAVEHGVHPRVTTEKNIENIERQIKMFGFSYDWSRKLATTDVNYYRWTQWIFLQLFNSYFDPAEKKALPVSVLKDRLMRDIYFVSPSGEIVYDVNHDMESIAGIPVGALKFSELPADEQRDFIDDQRLAYMSEVPVNWCPALGTVLANEEVTNEGKSERGNHPVFRRAMKQWMLRITAYAQRLLDDIERVDWPEPIKIMQRNWIGKSSGAEVDFAIDGGEDVITVYTTRPDTLFGATYMVLAPEHMLVKKITTAGQRTAVEEYVSKAVNKSDLERTTESKDKTGVFTGAYAVNPVNDKKIPIWVADYVLMGYGTGAIMAVPAHDTRDYDFAAAFDLPVIQVVETSDGTDWKGFTGDGVAVNSGFLDGLPTQAAKKKMTEWLETNGCGTGATNYKLRDWLFSRQRYWGEPFPIVHCPKCGTVALDESQLPLTLPDMEDFKPAMSDDPAALPQPPLGKATDWVNTICPSCGEPAKRELNTMPQWAGSCWYYLRYLDPKNSQKFCGSAASDYWMGDDKKGGVDLYVGGAEHAVLHLLYSRFWHKVLFDLGYVKTAEPFRKLFNQGMITSFTYRDSRGICVPTAEVVFKDDGAYHPKTGEKLVESVEKMSKSLRNVVNPDDIIHDFGADTFRLYEMFMGPLDASKPWNTRDVPGVHRFLQRVWRMIRGTDDNPAIMTDEDTCELDKPLNRLIKKVGEDVESMKFNTAIAAMMEFVNACFKAGRVGRKQAEKFLLVLAPFAPHIAEELWAVLGYEKSLAHESFPSFDETMLTENTVELPVQVNGKIRAKISVSSDADEQTVFEAAIADEKVAAQIGGKAVFKKILIPGRMLNIVVK